MIGRLRNILIAFLILTVPVFGGPKADVAFETQTLANAKSCCAGYAQLPFQALTQVIDVFQDLGAKEPAFDFGKDGLSYFRAYRITEQEKGKTLRIRSHIFSSGRKEVAFFFPVVTLLDAEKSPILVTGRSDMVFQQEADFSDWNTTTVHLNVTINLATYPAAEYLIVHTSHDYIGKVVTFTARSPDMMVSMGTLPIVVPGVEGDLPALGSPVAPAKSIKITVVGPKAKKKSRSKTNRSR